MMAKARPALLVLTLSLSGCITHPAPIPWERWRHTYPEVYYLPLAEKAQEIERNLLARHLSPEGLLVYSRPPTTFDASRPQSYGSLSDQAMWTGALLGAYAFKYRLSGDPADRELLLRILGGLELLEAVTGKPGLFARAVFPRSLGGELDADERRHPAAPPHDAYSYRGDVSKDQYFGVLFGYAAATVELGIGARSGDPELRRAMAGPVARIADHIWENGMRIVDVDGRMTTHGDLRGYILGVPIGPNAALSLGFQLLAARLTGEARFHERYRILVRRRYPEATRLVKFELFGKTNHNNDNMGLMGLYTLANLEADEATRRIYERSLKTLWSHIQNEGNAFFHLIYASRFLLPEAAQFDVRENLRLFPTDLRQFPVDLRDRPEIELAVFENRFGLPKNRTALPLHLRCPGHFIWTLCPYQVVTPAGPGTRSVSGADFLLAYWMARRFLGAFDDGPGLPAAVASLPADR
jgi:hypothetical protein